MFRLIDMIIDIILFSINWKNYFDRSILVISMTVLIAATLHPGSSLRHSMCTFPVMRERVISGTRLCGGFHRVLWFPSTTHKQASHNVA